MKEETKKCKHCQTDIPKKAKVCPACRKKQKRPLLGTILIILGVIIFIAAISNGNEENPQKVESTTQSTKQDTPQNSKDNETVFKVGETVEYKEVQISLLSYEESQGNEWGSPANGNIFVYAEFEIINNSNNEISISSMISFENYCDGYKLDYSSNALMAISTEDNKHQLDGSIAPGKKMKGVLGLEVPNNWENIEIYYKDNVWLDSNFSFVIEK